MKNLFVLIGLSTLVFFTSCSKEALLEPQTDSEVGMESVNEAYIQTADSPAPTPANGGKSSSISVTTETNFQTPFELIVDFNSGHDFSNTNLEGTQSLDFTNGSGNTVTLSFAVNSYTGSNGALEVYFAKGGNNLNGLDIKDAQIIVEEVVME